MSQNEDQNFNFVESDNDDNPAYRDKSLHEAADAASKKGKKFKQATDANADKSLHEAADTANKKGKNINQKTDDEQLNILESEKQRRRLFTLVVLFSILVVAFLYFMLAIWLLLNWNNHTHNVWHIAMILVLPPTTILFFLIKVLAKSSNDSKDDRQASTPAGEALEKSGELAEKCLDMLKTLLNKK